MCSKEWVERSEMFESWPYIMGELGAEKHKHWWTILRQRGMNATAKEMQYT